VGSFLIDSMRFSHGALDVKRLDVLPILLEQRDKEVDSHGDVGDKLVLTVFDVSDSNTKTQHFLQLELHSASNGRHLGFHVFVRSQQCWKLSCFVQTWSKDSGDLTQHCLTGKKRVILLGEFLDKFLVLVEFLESLNVFEFDSDLGGLIVVDLVSQNAKRQSWFAFDWQLDRSTETLVLLWIVVLQADL